MLQNQCAVSGCDKPRYCRGWCRLHYERWQRTGDPEKLKRWKGGIRKHPMYGAWHQMISRCHNPNNYSYGRYGARGTSVCDRWRYGDGVLTGFQLFLRDMGERPEGKTLDRIDPLGNYEPNNCRWATMKEQRANISKESDARGREASRTAMKLSWRTGRIRPRSEYLKF